MNILNTIVQNKKNELEERKSYVSTRVLESYSLFDRTPLDAVSFLKDKTRSGIIAEIKKSSPSKGVINADADVINIATGYEKAGASIISVLTEQKYFGGKDRDLVEVKNAVKIPVLRKDFIIDEYQLLEAKAIGADVILLIASILTPSETENLARFAKSLGLSVLLEVHDIKELNRNVNPYVDLVGVNNRNLKTFDISIDRSLELVEHIPANYAKISESGLTNPVVVKHLKKAGFDGFLIGESFMKDPEPAKVLEDYIKEILRAEKLEALQIQ